MEIVIWAGLLGVTAATVFLAVRERIRLKNFEAGQTYRDWIIERASSVVFDEDAPPEARGAAAMMLDCVYDRRRLWGILKHLRDISDDNQRPVDFREYEEFLQGGLECMVSLAYLEQTQEGRAFRRLTRFNGPALKSGIRRQLEGAGWTLNGRSPMRFLETV